MNLESLNKQELISHAGEIVSSLEKENESLRHQVKMVLMVSVVLFTLYLL